MCPVIRISDELYSRLESHAVGFDTPSALIERLLDSVEGIEKTDVDDVGNKPTLIFEPQDEVLFKELLLRDKKASVLLHKSNGSVERRIWNANRITESSNIRGNLWSGLLRGWKAKGIVKAELSILSGDANS